MHNKRNGPLSYAPAFAALLGITFSLQAWSEGHSLLISALISLLVSSSWIFIGTIDPPGRWTWAFLCVIIMTFAISLCLMIRMEHDDPLPSTIRTEGRILLNREWGRRRALLISTPYGRVTSYMHPSAAPAEGSGVRVRGALFDHKRADKKGGFDEFLYWRSKGAIKKMVPLDIEVTSLPGGIYRWRNFLERKINDELPDLMSGYMLALTLGIRDKKLAEKHRQAGTVHLLAVSGFHVGILAAAAGVFIKRGKIRIVMISVLIWSYLALAGFPPGGVRAGIMLQVYLLGLLFGKPSCPFNSVSIAGIIMLLWEPWTFHDIGWRLSMLAALSICSAAAVSSESGSGAFMGSAAVWFVTAPLIALAFGEVPVAGLIINIAAIPLFALIFPFVLISSIPAFMQLPFSYETASACEYILEGWDISSEKIVELIPWSVVLTLPLALFAAFIFFASASYASGMSAKRITVSSVMFSLLVLILS